MSVQRSDIVLNQVFRVSRIIGTFPFDHAFLLSKRKLATSTCLLIFCCTSSCYVQISNGTHPRRTIKILFTSFANVLSLGVLFLKRYRILSMYRTLLNVELDFRKDGISWDWIPTFSRLYISYFIFLSMLLVTVVVRYDSIDPYRSLVLFLSYFLTFPFALSIVTQFTTLNSFITSLFLQVPNFKDITCALVTVTNLHSACDTLKSVYGIQILLYISATFIFIICNVYFELTYNKNEVTWNEITHIVWILIIFYPFMDIIVSCNRTVSKARHVNEVLYETMIEDTSDSLINHELLAFHLTSCRELEFTACGFFTIDNSLICSMIACATTYLVILVQYTHPPVNTSEPLSTTPL